MAKKEKKQGFSIQGFDASHYKQTEAYAQAIDEIYVKAVNDFSKVASGLNINPDKPFSFDDYPTAKNAAQRIIGEVAGKMQGVITKGSREQWLYANKKADEFLKHILNTSKVPKKALARFQDRNLDALDAFQKRKTDGLDLSKRIWNYADQLKKQMELGIDIGVGDGKSAQELSRDLRQYLVDPDKLFRRVRDKHGNLVLSKAAKAFHPGQGKYRSSYKNAMRLTRTEINTAYRTADQLRWGNLDFVVGYEVKLSNNHTLNGVPFVDICDDLKGKYPKSFKFVGWHPQCRCFVVPILMDMDEFDTDELNELRAALKGTEYKQFSSRNTVNDVPQGFKDWVDSNAERSKGWSSQPYFIRDNFKGGSLQGGLKFDTSSATISAPIPAPKPAATATIKPILKPSPEQGFKPAKTVEAAKVDVQTIFANTSTINASSVSYHSSMTIDQINRANKQVYDLFNEYEVAKVYNASTRCDIKFSSGGSYYGRVVGMNDNTMLNEINFGHKFDPNRAVETGGFRPKSRVDKDNVDIATITHEFAHVITVDRQQLRGYIDERLKEFAPELRAIKSRYTKELRKLYRDGKSDEAKQLYLGDYASTNLNEFMAEAFTEYKLCSKPSKYAKEVGELIDKTFKRKK